MNNWLGPHYLQGKAWAKTRNAFDWKSVVVHPAENLPIRIYFRHIPLIGTYAYSPLCGPVLTKEHFDEFVRLAKEALPSDTFCIKIEPEQSTTDLDIAAIDSLQKAKKSIQFEATVCVDLDRETDKILASFDKGTRYNVRKAGRRGVVINQVEASEENLEKLYAFKQLTSKRGNHYLRPKSFLMQFWQETTRTGKGHLFFATHEDDLLAALFIVKSDVRCWNKDSGSSRKKRSLAAPSLMHWEAMQAMQALGVKEYDFSGVSPKEQRVSDDNPMHGVDSFKTGFAGPIDYVGAHDLVLDSARHRLWSLIEPLYIRLHHKITGLYWY